MDILGRETIQAVPTYDCPGLSPTDIILHSEKWEGYMITLGERGVEYWHVEYWDDQNGIHAETWLGKRRVTGRTTRYVGSERGECSVALVTVASGLYTGKTGWLVWGDEAGLAISGSLGDVTGALWIPNSESLPDRCREKVNKEGHTS